MRTICKASLLGFWLLALGDSLGAQEQKQPESCGVEQERDSGQGVHALLWLSGV